MHQLHNYVQISCVLHYSSNKSQSNILNLNLNVMKLDTQYVRVLYFDLTHSPSLDGKCFIQRMSNSYISTCIIHVVHMYTYMVFDLCIRTFTFINHH